MLTLMQRQTFYPVFYCSYEFDTMHEPIPDNHSRMITIQPHASEKIHHQVALSVLIAEFNQFLPATAIISEPEALRPFECDVSRFITASPGWWSCLKPLNRFSGS